MKSLGPPVSCYCLLKKNWAMGYLAGRLISARLNSLKSDEGCKEDIVVNGIDIYINPRGCQKKLGLQTIEKEKQQQQQ